MTKKPKVLLLSPPGSEIYIRDYYCSKISKTTYIYTPVDILIVSARLREHAELKAIDAIAEKMSVEGTLKAIKDFNPDTIVSMTASVSWNEDVVFFRKLREFFKGKLIASGDILMENPQFILQSYKELDAVLHDFSTDEIVDYCLGDPGPFFDIVLRNPDGKVLIPGKRDEKTQSYNIPVPRHDLFPLEKYSYPFVRKLPFATVLTDFGCYFKCTFCIQSTLDFKTRPAESVIEELRYLKKKGIKDIYFSDQTFAFNLGRAKKILNAMIEEKMNFGWVAFYRVDLVKEETLRLFKKAGCHTLMFGVESASEEIQKDYKKFLKLETIRKSIKLCKKLGIRTVGTFIFGFPEETREDINATIKFSLSLPLDYISYNIAVPRSNTTFRVEAIENNFISENQLVMDQSGKNAVMGNKNLSARELHLLRNKAIKKFYLRPGYLAKRLFSIRTWDEFKINVRDGMALLKEAR